MNASLAAAVVAALLTITWALGRRRVPLVRDADTSAVAALNRQQIALVQSGAADLRREATPMETAAPASPELQRGSAQPASLSAEWPDNGLSRCPAPGDVRQRSALLAELRSQHRCGGAARIQAMRLARHWGHPSVLPLLRLGLRDPDPAVVLEAAAGLELFRGRSRSRQGDRSQALRPPRNVARTR